MSDINISNLPFLVRKMLSFEHAVPFGLKLQIQSDSAFTVTIRGMTREGVFTLKQSVTGNSSVETFNFRIPDVPIMVCVSNDSGSLLQGQCYATLALTANSDVLITLCAGQVYQGHGISYPAQNIPEGMPNRGLVTAIGPVDPAAGANASQTIPIGEVWEIKAITFTLTTSATVASRRAHVLFEEPALGGQIHSFPSIDQTASQTIRYSFANYGTIPDETDDGVILVHLPTDLSLYQNYSIGTDITNLQAGDQISNFTIVHEKYFVGS